MIKTGTLLFLMSLTSLAHAQVRVENASFEGEAQDATTPVSWHPCEVETTPDIMPGIWGVHLEAAEGETYMGLITRKIGTWESVGQRLVEPLKSGECYSFSIELAHSATYAGYNMPVKFIAWGGNRKCNKDQILGEVAYVDHQNWRRYDFKFTTSTEINYLILEAHYMDGLSFSYKGNILVDNCSDFRPCRRASLD